MDKALVEKEVIQNHNLSMHAKVVYASLCILAGKDIKCNPDIKELCQLSSSSKNTVKKALKELEENGIIRRYTTKVTVEQLKNKNLKGLGVGNKECEWCGIKTVVLHQHHYPIPKSKGGTETVNICPNCHHEFHYRMEEIELTIRKKYYNEFLEMIKTLGL